MIEKECRNCGENFEDWSEDGLEIYCDKCKGWFKEEEDEST